MGRQQLAPSGDSGLPVCWLLSRASIPEEFRRSFDSLMLLVSWKIWKERNRKTFENKALTPAQLCALILEEADAWLAAGFCSLAPLLALAI